MLRNLRSITRVRDIQQAESEALLALQAGLPPLDFGPLAGRGKRAYFAAVQAVLDRDYGPLQACFKAVIRRSLRPYGEQVQAPRR